MKRIEDFLDLINKKRRMYLRGKAAGKFAVVIGVSAAVSAGITVLLLSLRPAKKACRGFKNGAEDTFDAIKDAAQDSAAKVQDTAEHIAKEADSAAKDVQGKVKDVQKDIAEGTSDIAKNVQKTAKNVAETVSK